MSLRSFSLCSRFSWRRRSVTLTWSEGRSGSGGSPVASSWCPGYTRTGTSPSTAPMRACSPPASRSGPVSEARHNLRNRVYDRLYTFLSKKKNAFKKENLYIKEIISLENDLWILIYILNCVPGSRNDTESSELRFRGQVILKNICQRNIWHIWCFPKQWLPALFWWRIFAKQERQLPGEAWSTVNVLLMYCIKRWIKIYKRSV